MFTKTLALTSLLAALTAAAPAPSLISSRPNPNSFVGIALHSLSAVHQRAINANDGKFLIGKAATTYCPEGVSGLDCSAYGNQTIFTATPSTGTLSLDVAVPGGQQIYVSSSGLLGYTIPHSGAIPANATTTGFEYTPQASEGTVGSLTWKGDGFLACPTREEGVYEVSAAAQPAESVGLECIGFEFGTAEWSGKVAYEYSP